MAYHRSGDMLQLFILQIGKFYGIIMIMGICTQTIKYTHNEPHKKNVFLD
jgi:hypothetical protein